MTLTDWPRWIVRWRDTWLQAPVSLAHPDGRAWERKEIGDRGEELAARWLRTEGRCRVLYRNFRAPDGGEVDIVCRHGDVLVFAEVKTRTSTAWGRPADAVTRDKEELIVRGAHEWMRLLHWPQIAFRFDIVEVLLIPGEKPHLNWLQAAFTLPERLRW